ncbi:MAG: hypothetical protein FKGGLIKP_00860 [Sodalis sp. Fse]|nr:MAG: hypothetical protein CMIDDMOC_00782 [Sodalis sp. Fle]UVK78206.1 MAG: hypothetical protein FKGGLIKP_00860 [Sodalis sp. Fse]
MADVEIIDQLRFLMKNYGYFYFFEAFMFFMVLSLLLEVKSNFDEVF